MYYLFLSKTPNHSSFARLAWSILSALLLLIPLSITACGSSGTPSSGPVILRVTTLCRAPSTGIKGCKPSFSLSAPYMVLV